MKKALYLITMMVAAVMMTACHSSEKNYREAYEKAVEARKTGIGAETYAKIEAERQRYTHVINGDSVRMVYLNVNTVDSTQTAQDYNVIVATFSQRINARSYCDRLREECGLQGSYVLFGGPDKKYFVVAQGFDNSGDAAAFIKEKDTKVCLKILEPLAWILRKL